MTHLVERNTTIPVRRSETFSTAEDNQPAVDVHVLQGERELAHDNRTLGHFRLEGIRPGPRGQPQIEVVFDIDANGILTVTARDKETSKEQQITITGSTQLSKQDIDRMVADAQAHGTEDKQRREEVEARNAADTIAYQVEREIQARADAVPVNEKARADALIQEVRKLVKAQSGDVSRLRQLADDLRQLAAGLAAAGTRSRPRAPGRMEATLRTTSSTPSTNGNEEEGRRDGRPGRRRNAASELGRGRYRGPASRAAAGARPPPADESGLRELQAPGRTRSRRGRPAGQAGAAARARRSGRRLRSRSGSHRRVAGLGGRRPSRDAAAADAACWRPRG